ncbi:MAG: glycosyltransferase family 9 protein [Verrucomicrobiota bacterium]
MSPHSILVVKPSSLGDVVHTLPAVSLLKHAWPQARLRWVINPEWAPLLEGNPDVDEIVLFPRRELSGSLFKQLRWLRATGAACRSDLVLDFQGLLRSALIGRFCRGGNLLGLSDAREGARFFYDRVARVGREHAVDRYLKLVAALGIDTSGPLTWNLPEGSRPAGFPLEEPFVLLHPFSRGEGKSLSPQEANAFAKALPCPVVLVGRSPLRLPEPGGNVIDLLNCTSFAELIWLIRRARFVVSVDSGPMHIAAALTPHLLSLHTWSDPALVGPYRPEAWVWKDRTLFQIRQLHTPPPPTAKPIAAPDLAAVAAHVSEWIA